MGHRTRKDVLRNNRVILRAAGEVLRDDPASMTIAAVAERARLSTPTVYRYYSSTEALLARYRREVLEQLRDFSYDSDATGVALFDAVLAKWGELVEEYGAGLVQLRSRRGLLDRLHSGDETIAVQKAALERPLLRLLRKEDIDDVPFDRVLFLYNQMFDTRDLLDLRAQGLTMPEVLSLMRQAFVAALRSWSRG